MKKYLYFIVILLVLPIILSQEVIKDIDTNSIDTRPTTAAIRENINLMPETKIFIDNTASVETKNFIASVDKFTANSNELVNLYIDASETITSVCFDFPVDVKDIEITEIKESVPYFFDKSIKSNEEKVSDNQLCYNTNVAGNDLYYKAVYHGRGTIKYNVTVNGIILDPYLIGDDLSESRQLNDRLVLRIPFDGNSSALPSYLSNTFPTTNLIRNASPNDYSDEATGGGIGNVNVPYLFDDNSSRSMTSRGYVSGSYYYYEQGDVYFNYTKLGTETGVLLQKNTSYDQRVDGGSCTSCSQHTLTVNGLDGAGNISVPTSCMAESGSIKFKISTGMGTVKSAGISYYCYGSGAWQYMYSESIDCSRNPGGSSCGIENGDYVRINSKDIVLYRTNNSNYTQWTEVTPKTQYYNVNGLVWSNSFGFYGNDSVSALKNDVNTSQTAVNSGATATSIGMSFDGASSSMTIPSNLTAKSYFTINMKLNIQTVSTTHTGVMSQTGTETGIIFRIDNGSFYAALSNGTTLYMVTTPYTNNINYDISMNYNNVTGNLSIYKNGVLYNSTIVTNVTNADVSNSFILGKYPVFNIRYFNGTISDVRIYNRSLSSDEVMYLYRGGNFSTNVKGESNKSIYLNSNEIVIFKNENLTNFYPNKPSSYSLFAKIVEGTPTYALYGQHLSYIWARVMLGVNYIRIFNTTTFTHHSFPEQYFIWNHLSYTVDTSNVKSYKNGVLKNQTEGISSYVFNTNGIDVIGHDALNQYGLINPNTGFKGYLDEFNVYNYVLSQDEIETLAYGFNSSILLSIVDANTGTPIQTANLQISDLTNTYYKEKSTGNGQIFLNGLTNKEYKLLVSATGYTTNTIYYTITGTNVQENVTVYLANETLPQYKEVYIIVKDKADDSILTDALVNTYAEIDGNYSLISQKYTNPNGAATFSLIKDNIFYKFTVYYGATKCYETVNPFTITTNDDTIIIYCKLNSPFYDTTYAYKSINTTISFLNTSNETFYYSYQGQSVHGGNTYCWYLYQVSRSGDILLNSTCEVGSNVLLTTNTVNTSTNTQDTTYYLKGCVTPANYTTPDCQFNYHTIKSGTSIDFTGIGLALTIGLAIFIFFALIRIPQAAIIGVTLIIALSSALNIIKLPLFNGNEVAGTISIIAIGIVLSFIITKRASP